jgi:Protein of unknown function (DUF2510)
MNARNENPLGPALAAGGALLLFISLLLNWNSLDVQAQGQELSVGIARPDTATLLLAAVAATAGIIALGRFRGTIKGMSTVLAALGLGTFLYVLVSIIKKPQLLDLVSTAFDEAKSRAGEQISEAGADFGVGIGPGLWIALVASLLLLAAGLMEMLGLGPTGGGRSTGAGAGAPAQAGPGGFGGGPGGPGAGATPTGTPTMGAGAQATPTPSPQAPADPSPGWKPDPYGQASQRWWDGSSWTQHTG